MNKLQLTIVGLLCFVTGYSQVLLSEDFSTATGTTPPSGWTNNDLNSSGEIWEFNNPGTRTLNAPISSPAAIFDSDNYGSGSAEDATLESPAFDASSGTIVLTFDHYFRSYFGSGYAVEVFDGTDWDTIISGSSSTSDPQAEYLDITTLTGGSTAAKIRFHWTGDWAYYWIVDNITISAVSCLSPSTLGATNLATTAADLYWTTGGASDWNVEYGLSGFAQGGGTLVNATNDTTAIIGLTANTAYEFYVRDSCGVGNVSAWAGPFAFTTAATPLVLPYNNDFETTLTDFTNGAGNTDNWVIDTAASSGSSSIKNAYSASANNTLVLPNPIDLSVYPNALLTFDQIAKTEGTYDECYVEYSTDGGLTWLEIPASNYIGSSVDYASNEYFHEDSYSDWGTTDITPTNAWWKTEVFSFTGLSTGLILIRFNLESDGSAQREGWYIDNLSIVNPSCVIPTALGVDNVTATSADLFWTTGGASDWNIEYGPTGFTLGGGTKINVTNDTITITGLSANNAYEFYVRDSCGAGDVSLWEGPFAFTTPCASQLSGTYTIDAASPAGGTNYNSFAQAAAELRDCGVSGAVTFNIAAGTYTENLYLTEILGASSTNTITFDGADSALVTLTYSSSDDTATVYLNGADYISVKNMTIENTSSGDGWGVLLQNSANYNTIDSCHVKMPITTTTDIIGIVATSSLSSETGTGDNTNNLTVSNCLISGAETGVHLEGGTSNGTHNTGNSIINSVFRNQDDHAIEVDGQTGLNVSGNDIDNLNNSAGDGIYLVDVDDIEVSGNQVIAPDYGIYINDANDGQTPTVNSMVVNNMVISSADNGLYLNDIEYVEVYHNTVVGEPAFLVNDQTNTLIIKNNVFYSTADYALEFLDTLNTTDVIDYNLYYSGAGDAFEILTTVYTDLPAWQAANATLNVSSIDGDPIFLNIASDLHLVGTLANNAADPITGITVDIDGDVRSSTTPDIGADEFTPASCLPSSAGVAGNITSTSADLSWTAGGGSTFNIEYGLSGYTQGAGTQVTGVTNPYPLTGLSGNTTYDFYIQDDCGTNGTSPWVGPFSFTTLCPVYSAPFLETFTGTTTPACWAQSATSGGPWVFTGTPDFGNTYAMPDHTSGVTNNYAWVDQSSTDAGVILEGPVVDVSTLTTPTLSYWIVSHNNTSSVTDFNILYAEAWDGTAWVAVDSVEGDYGLQWVEFTADLSPYVFNTDQVQVRFRVESGGDTDDYDNDILLDDVGIIEAPTCFVPSALGTDTTSATTADIYWTTGGSSDWNVEYDLAGFVPGTGTAVNSTNDTLSVTGLTSNLLYEFYVRDSCAVGDVSGWAGPFKFHSTITPCDDFEIYTVGIVDSQSAFINGWAGAGGDAEISTAYASSGSNSLKIHESGPLAFSDVVAEVGVYNSGSWKLAFDFYVPSGNYGYYNILHDYQGGGTNVWATEIYLEMGGTATVMEGTNGSDTIGNYSFNMGAWNTVEHIIDLDNDTAYLVVNGVTTNVGWQFSLGSTNFGDQFNAVNFYSTAPTGQTFMMYVDDFCITPHTVPCNNTAGLDSAATVCATNATVDLSNYLRSADPMGTWVDMDATGALAGTTFDATAVTAGNSYDFSYFVTAAGCPDDTATITINVSVLPDAGAGATDTICDSLTTVDLTVLLDAGATSGGTWMDVSGSGALSGAIFNPSAVAAGSTYTFRYMVTDSCGADSADFALHVKDCGIGIREFSKGSVAVYPNPGNGIFYVENLGNGSQTFKVEVFTVDGKLLMTRNYNGSNKGSLELGRFASGVYYLKVVTDDFVELHPVMKE